MAQFLKRNNKSQLLFLSLRELNRVFNAKFSCATVISQKKQLLGQSHTKFYQECLMTAFSYHSTFKISNKSTIDYLL